jgi:peptide/nickel transport system permease protein
MRARAHVQRVSISAVLRRVAGAALLFWLVVTLIFALVRMAPGDPATLLVSPSATAAEAERLRADLGLNEPVAVQYARWAGQTLRGNLGESFALHIPVSTALAQAAPISLALGLSSVLLTFLIGVPLGLMQAALRGTFTDRLTTVLTATIFAAPTFWVALALVAMFTYGAATLGLPPELRLPALGVRTPGLSLTGWAGFADLVRHAILPVAALAAVGAAGIARYARSNFADLIDLEMVNAARARGASRWRVLSRHVVGNALPSIVVLFALTLPGVVAGSVFIESVFAWPGLGRLTLTAIAARDYPVVLGAGIWYAGAVIVANLLADVVLPILDPRRRSTAA